jgi:hypothetical protein
MDTVKISHTHTCPPSAASMGTAIRRPCQQPESWTECSQGRKKALGSLHRILASVTFPSCLNQGSTAWGGASRAMTTYFEGLAGGWVMSSSSTSMLGPSSAAAVWYLDSDSNRQRLAEAIRARRVLYRGMCGLSCLINRAVRRPPTAAAPIYHGPYLSSLCLAASSKDLPLSSSPQPPIRADIPTMRTGKCLKTAALTTAVARDRSYRNEGSTESYLGAMPQCSSASTTRGGA